MKTLVIPDIHNKIDIAQQYINHYPADEVVFLGDYFDDFNDTPDIIRNVAYWVKENIHNPNYKFLLGNHEFNYMYGGRIDICSGFDRSKNGVINKILDARDWNEMLVYYETQGFYLTHAGITRNVFGNPVNGWNKEVFEKNCKYAREILFARQLSFVFQVGMMRGGYHPYGGLTWCHFPDEFTPIPEIKQIFGHSPGYEVRRYENTDNWCIDTHLNDAVIIEENKVKFIQI